MTARRKVLRFYRDGNGEHRWQLKGGNGSGLCTPGEGFKTLASAEKNAGASLGGTVRRTGLPPFARATIEGRDDLRVEYAL